MNSVALPHLRADRGRAFALPALGLLLLSTAVISLGTGAIRIPASEVLGALLRSIAGSTSQGDDQIVLMLRLPRVLMAALVGASLACSGAAMQGLFRNPLVEPGLIGVSAGAALGAIGMMVLGAPLLTTLPAFAGSISVAGMACMGGLAATALV